MPGGEGAEEFEALLRLHEGQADISIVEDIDQVVGGERVDLGGLLVVPLTQAEKFNLQLQLDSQIVISD